MENENQTITITAPFDSEDRTITISLKVASGNLVGIFGKDSEGRRFRGAFSFVEERADSSMMGEAHGTNAARSRCCCRVDRVTGEMVCTSGPCRHDDDDNDDQ